MSLMTEQNNLSFRSIVDGFSKPIVVFNTLFSIVYVNEQFRALFGNGLSHLRDLSFSAQSDLQALENQISSAERWVGEVSAFESGNITYKVTMQRLNNSDRSLYIGVFELQPFSLVKTESRKNHIDYLTDLPNRYSFDETLRSKIKNRSEASSDFAVIYIDLDHFKDINELYGHETGDDLLSYCAGQIRTLLRKSDYLSRLSGDEFGAIVECKEVYELQYLCHRIMRFFDRPIKIKKRSYQFSVSIGVAFYPDQGESATELIINAEKAMFEAKRSGRAQFQFFDRKQSNAVEHRQRIAENLRYVLREEAEQITSAYQPLYSLKTGEFVGLEVLARWTSPEFGSVSPSDFISIAESRGLINTLTFRLFRAIEFDLSSIAVDPSRKRPILAINVSAQQIGDPLFEGQLYAFNQTVENSGWQLELELTESQMMSLDDRLITHLKKWRSQGIRISLDDFGTGYSCLAYLHTLPIDKIKIDRQFLNSDGHTDKQDQIFYAIVSMARALGFEILVEGIESTDHFKRINGLGSFMGQGFGLAKPSPWHSNLTRPLRELNTVGLSA